MARRAPLLVYLTGPGDPHRLAVAPALAAAAERAGWGFDLYHAELRRGRHFGGGDPAAARPGVPSGGLVAGGRHADRVLWLAGYWDLFVLGAPRHPLWPAFEAAGATVLARSTQPAALYDAAFDTLDEPVPSTVVVLDGEPGGAGGLIVAPYLYPAILGGAPSLLDPSPCIALEVTSDEATRVALERLGARRFLPLGLDTERAKGFPRGFDTVDPLPTATTYTELTADLAERAAGWAQGVLLGDPALGAWVSTP